MQEKIILNDSDINKTIFSMTEEISKDVRENDIFLGIDQKGKILANRIKEKLKSQYNCSVLTGMIDTSL